MAFFVLSIIAGLVDLGCVFALFDSIVKVMSSRFPELWIASGRPAGYFWVPDGADWLDFRARQRLFFRLTFSKPDWIRKDGEANKIWRKYICCYIILWIVWALAIAVMLVYLPLY